MILESYRSGNFIKLKRWFFEIKKKDFADYGYEFIIEDEDSDWVELPFSETGAYTEKGAMTYFTVMENGKKTSFGTFVPYKCTVSIEKNRNPYEKTVIVYDTKTGKVADRYTIEK